MADQPTNVPDVATAVSVTVEFSGKFAVQLAPLPQLIPGVSLVIVPVPCPTS